MNELDLATSKTVYIDGKKIGRIQRMDITFGLDNDLRTLVTIHRADKDSMKIITTTYPVVKSSLHITDIEGKPGQQRVEFSTINGEFREEFN